MRFLYLDDSGSVNSTGDRHVILAGLSVFERRPFWLSEELDRIAQSIWPNDYQSIEFRGNAIFAGRGIWRSVDRQDRIAAFKNALLVLQRDRDVRIFGAAIHKEAISPNDPMEHAFEQLCNRFDRFLLRMHRAGNTERGLIVLDKSAYETTLQALATDFRISGHQWGRVRNIAEVPLFVDSRATRLIQYADMIAYSLRRYYERGESEYLDLFANRIDSEGSTIHGLVHFTPSGEDCNCISCRQRSRA